VSQPDFDVDILMSEPIVTESSAIDGIVLKEEDENSTDGTYGKETRVQPSDEVETAGIFDSNGSAAEEPENATVDASEQVTLLMVGDILLHVPVEKSAKREDGSYSYDAIFAETKELIQAADLALVNQEVILGGTELGISGYPAFNAPYEVGDDLVEAGFDVICHATNHALDKGKKGVTNCLNFWKTNYPEITILGLHENPEDPLYIFEKDGIKVAFLNYTYGTNGISLPEDMPYAVDLLSNKSKVIADIQYAESVADFTVVCPHWGTEYRLTADASQEKWTKIFLENGVDLVLGTHPHVIEPVEQITDEETGHSMLVYYSLGNYVNWTSSSGDGIANRMVGGMAQITLERGEDGEVAISDYA
jgi:poly-gamma-glutamate synthesis protein (capsule biosynthesis protein)